LGENLLTRKTTPNFCLWNLVQHIIIKDGDVFALRERVRLRLVRGERHGLGRGYAAIRGGNRQVRFLLLCLLLLLRFSLLGPPNFSFVARGQILFVSPLFLFGYTFTHHAYLLNFYYTFYSNMDRFGKVCSLQSFKPFKSAKDALEQINAISEGVCTDLLHNFLEQNLPRIKDEKKAKFTLGVLDSKLGNSIVDSMKIPCVCNDSINEMTRGVRIHFGKFIKGLKEGDYEKAQLGLAHSYSRAKVKFNVNRSDNMIIQAIALIDTLDKDINTFVMRVREWYGWHFPELVKIIADNYMYCRCALAIKDKATLSDGHVSALAEITGDEDKAKEVVEAAKASMGQDISPVDMMNIESFAKRVIKLAEYRTNLHNYLNEKMQAVRVFISFFSLLFGYVASLGVREIWR